MITDHLREIGLRGNAQQLALISVLGHSRPGRGLCRWLVPKVRFSPHGAVGVELT